MAYLIGMIIGCVVSNIIFFIRYRYGGTIRIDHSNPEKDVYRFEIDDLNKLSNFKRIRLKIDHNSGPSQK